MTNKTRLKPCPFCGGAAKEHDRFNANVVTCRGCGVKVRQSAMGQGDAAEIWNRRTAPETFISVNPSDEEIDRLAGMMPDGAGGMLTQWGYRQFARQVISSCVTPASPEPVGFFNGRFGGDVNGNMWFTVQAYGAIPTAGAKVYTAPVTTQPGVPDGDIVDSQERILDAAERWAEQRDIGPAYAKAAWADFQLRVQAELNYTYAIASDPQEDSNDDHPDDVAVQTFAQAMKAKLAKKRADGRGGWQQCDANTLSSMLSEHVAKGDPVDVANLAMMLHQNGQSICRVSDFSEGVNIERLRRAMVMQGIAAPESLEELAATLARHINTLTLVVAEKKHKCDGNHGGPRCADHECWNDGPTDPIFWYRPRSDGGYEGPLHNSSIEEVRKRCGAWVPLFAGRAPEAIPESSADSLKSALRPFSEEFKQWDGVGCWDSMTLDEMFSHAPGETASITFADLRRANEALENP